MSSYSCRVCLGIDRLGQLTAREMMFGTKETFLYDLCTGCKSLQLHKAQEPSVTERHYPDNYYSRETSAEKTNTKLSYRFRQFVRNRQLMQVVGKRNPIGAICNLLFYEKCKEKFLKNISIDIDDFKIDYRDHILDVGCGEAAIILNNMSKMGFANILGADPFIKLNLITMAGVRVLKARVDDIEDKFDLVMFHHSFEHILSSRQTLSSVRERPKPGSRCLIRILTPSSEAFEIYGADWVQLDAPRHMTLISRAGMEILARDCGFEITAIRDDSSAFQFTGSMLCRRDIPLIDQSDLASWFSREELETLSQRAQSLNAAHRGDQAAFILRKI
jgi:2-polyprenyl-3-methyl-5-hydroxy-6-metoxy-1,4-benzoquinol methylase